MLKERTQQEGQLNVKTLVIVLLFFFLITISMVALRTKTETLEVKSSDILIALIPIAIWLILSRKVKVVEFAGFKIEAALAEASRAAIESQIASIPVDTISMETKGGTEAIPRLIRNRTEALVFRLGSGYAGHAILQYLQELSQWPFFKYIIVNDRDGNLFCMVDARELNSAFSAGVVIPEDLAQWLAEPDTDALVHLPECVSAEDAVHRDDDKQTVLEQMEELNAETLPVIDEAGGFVGVVNRSRLVSSLIIEVAGKIR